MTKEWRNIAVGGGSFTTIRVGVNRVEMLSTQRCSILERGSVLPDDCFARPAQELLDIFFKREAKRAHASHVLRRPG